MLAIQGLKCIYDTGARAWAMELVFVGEESHRRFDVDGPDDAEMLVDAFEDSTSAMFDPTNGEITFAYEYTEAAHDDEEESEDEDDSEDDDADDNKVAKDDDGDDGDDNKDDTTRKVA